MPKIDLHTHSIASKDGGITLAQYQLALETGTLDCIAITDHDRIDFALTAQEQLGNQKIIVGQEITTKQGDIIGLYLSREIPAGLDVTVAIEVVKQQGGLVYIPHPFETVRSGISMQVLDAISKEIDIVETVNGRASAQNFTKKATAWATTHQKIPASSSDAHRAGALGKTYTVVDALPQRSTLTHLLSTGTSAYKKPSLLDIAAPKYNRLRKMWL